MLLMEMDLNEGKGKKRNKQRRDNGRKKQKIDIKDDEETYECPICGCKQFRLDTKTVCLHLFQCAVTNCEGITPEITIRDACNQLMFGKTSPVIKIVSPISTPTKLMALGYDSESNHSNTTPLNSPPTSPLRLIPLVESDTETLRPPEVKKGNLDPITLKKSVKKKKRNCQKFKLLPDYL